MITLTLTCTPLTSSIDKQKIDYLYSLLKELKDKLKKVTSYPAKIQMLTLTPESWSLPNSAEFNVSIYKRLEKLKKKHGILYHQKKGRCFPMKPLILFIAFTKVISTQK